MAYRERQKISQMTPKGANLEATDLLEVSTIESGSYVTKSITGEEIINAASGGSQDLQSVTDNGNTTTNNLIVNVDNPIDNTTISDYFVKTQSGSLGTYTTIDATNGLKLKLGDDESLLKNTNVTNPNVILEFPNKAAGSYTIATTSDLTSGYIPYTGATQNVDLGTFHLDAGKGTFSHNGSTDTLTANHTSGSGIGLLITKGGSNEGLKVNKTSGSGNAATIIGTLEATTLVKTGGTSTQFLMADGSVSTSMNPRVQTVTSSATVTATSTNDIVTITAQAVGLTLANPTGTFVEGQSLIIRIKDNGTARSIAYGTNFRAIGVTAPTTTTANKTTYIGCIYNSTDTKFDIVGTCTEA
jgi:hypothetical protein